MLKRRSEIADDPAAFRAKKFAASPESGAAVTPGSVPDVKWGGPPPPEHVSAVKVASASKLERDIASIIAEKRQLHESGLVEVQKIHPRDHFVARLAAERLYGWCCTRDDLLAESMISIERCVSWTLSEVDADGNDRIALVSEGFCRLTGYSRQEAVGRSCQLLNGPRTSRENADRIKQVLLRRATASVQIIHHHKKRGGAKEGLPFWDLVHMIPVELIDNNRAPRTYPSPPWPSAPSGLGVGS